jgi:hypothetical protein
MSTLGGVLLAGLAGMMTAIAVTDWMVVDVRVADPDAMHIVVPFPLFIADIATNFIPDEALQETEVPPVVSANRELIMTAIEGLLDAPDTALVKVQTSDELVEIAKHGDNLTVAVDADDAKVRCTIPLDGVLYALERWDWETFDPELVFDTLGKADNGNLVLVEVDDGTEVAIKLW